MRTKDPRFKELSINTFLLKEIKITAMPPAAKCVTYGTPFSPTTVKITNKHGDERIEKVLGYEKHYFSVPNDEHGVQTVAMACGYGYSAISPQNEYNRSEYDKLGVYWGPGGIAKFTVPAIAISPQTTDFYVLWGLQESALVGSIYKDARSEAEQSHDRHDIYQLLLNLPAGGILFQSGKSGTITEVVKIGDMWNLSLLLPIIGSDLHSAEKYYETFKAAYDYFRKKHFRECHWRSA